VQLSLATRFTKGQWWEPNGAHDTITTVPYTRWDLEAPRSGKSHLRARFGSFLADVDCFDATQFGISWPEAELMDPQQRMLLEVTFGTNFSLFQHLGLAVQYGMVYPRFRV